MVKIMVGRICGVSDGGVQFPTMFSVTVLQDRTHKLYVITVPNQQSEHPLSGIANRERARLVSKRQKPQNMGNVLLGCRVAFSESAPDEGLWTGTISHYDDYKAALAADAEG